ncbi:hypothetical protein DSL72_002528 [Monilinia vaccinii-corymbosi]|uniref:Dynactin subunit 5 n=1 Tax=Monilinia vaccinii-corymbosi TaxID=61207 RepID=A0A8A3PCX4_9HELO|nr:hypothetical protein DSL72_002528 [Monilinia vaccinii-corymbosi]
MTSALHPPNANARISQPPTVDNKSTDTSPTQPQMTRIENPPISHATPHATPIAVMKSGPTTIEDLPNELLVNIFSHLDTEAPSSCHRTLHDQPTLNLTNSSTRDLKRSSIISKRWRQATLPLLFKYTRYILEYAEDDYKPILNDLVGPFLQFVRTRSLADIVSSFTLVVREDKISNCLDGRPRPCEFDSFWQRLFHAIDPSSILIAAPVEALASLTSAAINPGDTWIFKNECHYLRLQRPASKETNTTESKNLPGLPESQPRTMILSDSDEESLQYNRLLGINYARSEILQVRPWTSLLLNEGSNLEAYKVHTWWELTTPSILQNLLGYNGSIPLIGPGIRSMEYIAIFPITSHFEAIARRLPRLDHLYCQLVPRNNILEDLESVRNVEIEDLWMERNNCYAVLLREMFNNPPEANYRYLKTFESGDAADTDAWEMAVEFVKRAGGAWKITGDGVFERDPVSEESSSDEPDTSPFNSAFQLQYRNPNAATPTPSTCCHVTMSRKAPKGEYIETDTGNKVSRRSQIIGTTNIILGGKTVIQAEVIIRGDLLRTLPSSNAGDKAGSLVAVAIGRYCFFSRGCELRPPGKVYRGTFSYFPLKIGDHVFVGPGSIIEAAMLGNHVHIGANVVVGKFVIVKDFVKILDGTVVPPGMVIPSFSVVGGIPGRVVGEVAEGEIEGMDLREMYRGVRN